MLPIPLLRGLILCVVPSERGFFLRGVIVADIPKDLNELFQSKEILNKDNKYLTRVLLENLCLENIPNPETQHRAVIRGLTINTILMQRQLDNLNYKATILQIMVILIAIITLIIAIL